MPWPHVLATGSAHHSSAEAAAWHFQAKVSKLSGAIPDTSHPLPSAPSGHHTAPCHCWDTSLPQAPAGGSRLVPMLGQKGRLLRTPGPGRRQTRALCSVLRLCPCSTSLLPPAWGSRTRVSPSHPAQLSHTGTTVIATRSLQEKAPYDARNSWKGSKVKAEGTGMDEGAQLAEKQCGNISCPKTTPTASQILPSAGARVSCDILADATRTYLRADPLHSLLRSGDSNEEQKKDERVTSVHSPSLHQPSPSHCTKPQNVLSVPTASKESLGLSWPRSSLLQAAWPPLPSYHWFLQPHPSLPAGPCRARRACGHPACGGPSPAGRCVHRHTGTTQLDVLLWALRWAHGEEPARRGQPCSCCRVQQQGTKHHGDQSDPKGHCESSACQRRALGSFSEPWTNCPTLRACRVASSIFLSHG